METKDPITFKCDPNMFQSIKSGQRKFDPRRYDMRDYRIYQLSWYVRKQRDGALPTETLVQHPERVGDLLHQDYWALSVKSVRFVNNATEEMIDLEFLGMEFADWAPGWCFLRLGQELV